MFHLMHEFLTEIHIKNVISHFWLEFLTLLSRKLQLLTFDLNFSLSGSNFATFTAKFSLLQQISHFSSWPHSHSGRPLLCRQPAPLTPTLPMAWLLPCFWHVLTAGRSPFDMPACKKWEIQSEKWEIRAIAEEKWEIRAKSEKLARSCWKSEKFEP